MRGGREDEITKEDIIFGVLWTAFAAVVIARVRIVLKLLKVLD